MAKRFLVLIALLMLGFFIAGCAEGDKSSNVTNPNPDVFAPTGSISGVVFNPCTNTPVKGAVVSLAYAGSVHQVTTAANGGYGFNNVPANAWDNNEDYFSADNGYVINCDLTKVTGYGYAVLSSEVYVYYSDLADGSNTALGNNVTEGGSGASTPVDKLAASYTFNVSALTSSISGTIFDVSTGLVGTAATVQLYLNGNFVATTTASAAGVFSFTSIMAAESEDYTLQVTKAGYEFDSGEKIADLEDGGYGGPNDCDFLGITCSVPCNGALTGVEVNLVFNPAKDVTVPFITSVNVGTTTDVYSDDDVAGTRISPIVLNFSEAMKTTHTTKNAFNLVGTIEVTITSSGVTGAPTRTTTITDATDFTAIWTTGGIKLGIVPVPISDAAAITAAKAVVPALPWTTTTTITYGTVGKLILTIKPWNAALTDMAYNPWAVTNAGGGPTGYQFSPGAAIQNGFILDPVLATPIFSTNWTFTVLTH